MYMYNDRYEWREEGGGFGVLELSWAGRRIVCGLGVEDGGWRVRVLEGVAWRVGGSEFTWAARRIMSVSESLSASCGAAAGGAVGARRSRSLCPSRCADRSKVVNLRGTASEILGMLQSEIPSV